MNLWIIYDEERFSKNQFFAQRLKESFEKRNLSVEIIKNGRIPDGKPLPQAAVMRCVHFELSRFLENQGVRVYNKSQVAQICNDKWTTYQFAAELGIPFLPVCLVRRNAKIPQGWAFPFVMKSRLGHGGTEVFWINDFGTYQKCWEKIQDETVLLQKVAGNLGKDVRVYVLGGKIVVAMLRESSNDFRSNYCLGGQASLYQLNPDEKKLIYPIIEALPFDFVGIDFIFNRNKMVFNEIEDVVGCRMVYALTNLDLAQEYADYIIKKQSL